MRIVDALKELGKKCNTSGTAPSGKTIAGVIANIASSFNINGAKGDDGASVKAIELELTDGVVSGGTATLTDDTAVTITVTTASEGD